MTTAFCNKSRRRRRSSLILLTGVFSGLVVIKEQLVILSPFSVSSPSSWSWSSLSHSATITLTKHNNMPGNEFFAIYRSSVTEGSNSNATGDVDNDEALSTSSYSSSSSSSSSSHSARRSLANSTTTLPLCTRQQIRVGQWIPATLDAPPYIVSTVHLKCYPDEMYHQGFWNTYNWQPYDAINVGSKGFPLETQTSSTTDMSSPLPSVPSSINPPTSSCVLTRWDSNEFCTLMRHSTILIIGDSLSWEHFRSLNHLLGKRHVSQHAMWESKSSQDNFKTFVCKNQVRLVFRRDDLLTNVTDSIVQTFPQIVVLNRGSHYKNDTTLLAGMNDEVIPAIQQWQHQCTKLGIRCHLFWRTSVPGHPGCSVSNYTEPVNDITVMEQLIANMSMYDNRTKGYHWYDYQHQNRMVVDLLQKKLKNLDTASSEGSSVDRRGDGYGSYLGNTFDIIDAYDINVLRPDEHRAHQGDCLHNCYPGKMDVYSQLLLHFLKMRRTEQDVETLIAFQDAVRDQRNVNNNTGTITTR